MLYNSIINKQLTNAMKYSLKSQQLSPLRDEATGRLRGSGIAQFQDSDYLDDYGTEHLQKYIPNKPRSLQERSDVAQDVCVVKTTIPIIGTTYAVYAGRNCLFTSADEVEAQTVMLRVTDKVRQLAEHAYRLGQPFSLSKVRFELR